MERSTGLGVPVDVMESVTQVAGPRAARLEGQYNAATSRPGGARQAQAFEAQRAPIIRETGREMVDELGGGIPPQDVTAAADDVFENIRVGANNAADPFYARADARRLPPTWVPQHPYIDAAVRRVTSGQNSEGRLWDLGQRYTGLTGRPGPAPANSIVFMDAVRKDMITEAGRLRELGGPANNEMAAGIMAQVDRLTSRMDTVSPDYQQARGIFETAMGEADNLRAGPLRSLENAGSTAESQAGTVFGVSTGADAANSSAALSALGDANPDVPRGLLANHIDAAVSSDVARPDAFGTRLFPNEHSSALLNDVLGPGGSPQIRARLEAARAVDPYQARNDSSTSGLSPWTQAYDYAMGFGTDKAVAAMQDPRFIRQLGRTGPTHEALQTVGRAVNQEAELDEVLRSLLERMNILRADAASR
jgi:hypothetical protein